MPIYMQYGDIKGDATADGHKGEDGWVEINSFQYGIDRQIASPTGGSRDREASAPSISTLVVTKPSDCSSPAWMEQALYGEGQDVTIDFCKTDKGELEVYQSYALSNALVSGYAVSSGGDRPHETITISFTKIIFSYFEMDPTGAGAASPKTGWDTATAKAV